MVAIRSDHNLDINMEQKEIKELISQTSIFNGLDDTQKTQLANICHIKRYRAGQEIIKEGDPGDGFYVIVEGQLTVLLPKNSKLGKERFSQVKLNTLVAGNCFGEYSLIDQHAVSATIEAHENSTILKIDKHDFQNILDNDLYITKTIYHNLLKLFIGRLRKHDDELDSFYDS
jgi:CRP-like cAMP-binding protein